MSQPQFKNTFTILENHIDTFGHVNNAKYLELFEQARWDIITGNGYGVKEVQKYKVGPVVLEMNLKFLKELKLRETITIETHVVDATKKIGVMNQQMVKENGEVACTASFVYGLFDLNARKLIEPTPEWLKAVGVAG